MTSPNLTDANIERLAELFPSVVTETLDVEGNPSRAIDFDLLRQELSDHIVEGPRERYQLDWPGKRAAAFTANAPIAKTLRPAREKSVDFDTTKNIFIEGDNLDALKLLQESYLGKIKLIYIDPPYNTGNDFVYNDDFAETAGEYLTRSGQADGEGSRLVANPETNGRFHSDWLSMIYPRLKLARNLLAEDGAIFISIDDSEIEDLKRLAAEVFGESNHVGTMVWAAGRKNDSKYISASHEYIVCFARNLAALKELGVSWQIKKKGLDAINGEYKRLRQQHGDDHSVVEKGLKTWYSGLPDSDPSKRNKHYSSVDARGIYFPSDLRKPQPTSRSRYDIVHPVTGRAVNMHPNGWSFAPERMEVLLAEDRIRFGSDESTRPTLKVYLAESDKEAPYSVFYQDGRGASKRLASLMGGQVFDFPKDETVLQTLVEMVTAGDDIVLDFFAGSGTTAHAVMDQNLADGGSRRFILVQLDEKPNPKSEAAAQGYSTIADLARERIRRAGTRVIDKAGLAGENLDVGFRSLKVSTTNMADVFRSPDETDQLALADLESSVKSDRSGEDLLFQVLLDWGLELAMPIAVEQIDGHEVFIVEDGALTACFGLDITPNLVRTIAKREPLRAVFRDAGFASDDARINAEQIFREMSPATEVKAI